jgi:hypothetical protein
MQSEQYWISSGIWVQTRLLHLIRNMTRLFLWTRTGNIWKINVVLDYLWGLPAEAALEAISQIGCNKVRRESASSRQAPCFFLLPVASHSQLA